MRGKLLTGSMLVLLAALTPWQSPTFSTQRVISSQADLCFDVRTEDVDQDGDLDIASASYDGLIAWWEYDGANPPGPWTKHVVTVFADGARGLPAQIDGDSDLDFLTATFNTSEVMWFENGSLPNLWQEHPSFNAPSPTMSGRPTWMATAIRTRSPYSNNLLVREQRCVTPVFFAEHLLTQQSGRGGPGRRPRPRWRHGRGVGLVRERRGDGPGVHQPGGVLHRGGGELGVRERRGP
jgi:hypothetical protein